MYAYYRVFSWSVQHERRIPLTPQPPGDPTLGLAGFGSIVQVLGDLSLACPFGLGPGAPCTPRHAVHPSIRSPKHLQSLTFASALRTRVGLELRVRSPTASRFRAAARSGESVYFQPGLGSGLP